MSMRFIISIGTFLLAGVLQAQTYAPCVGCDKMKIGEKVPVEARFFQIKDVRLLDSPFKKAMQLDVDYLLALEPDRLLHRFRVNAGLQPKGEVYSGWESMGISGHTLGHYLSALSLAWASTGDTRLIERLNYTIDELDSCQQARKTGYIGAIPGEDSVFADISAGKITSAGFDLNGLWVPWYTIHKIFAGLEDAWLYADNEKALNMAIRFGDWVAVTTKNLSDDNWQKMLACEHGGMNETMANLYTLSGDVRYLELSRKFHHRAILDPLEQGTDILPGKHANTQIPKIIGCARRYEIAGDTGDMKIARFFGQTVVKKHSYVIGANSNYEHFGKPDRLNDELSENTAETCNTNNMLKLTRHLFELQPSAAFMDYYERALLNHILASQNPADGMVCYYVPLNMGGQKHYSTPFNDFWCCVGTGIENHVKYGESIYAETVAGDLMVNLFIPSELNWESRGLKIRQESGFPLKSGTRLVFSGKNSKHPFSVLFRYPGYAKNLHIKINGKPADFEGAPGTYVRIHRKWKNGDRLELNWDIALYTESMPDNPKRIAFLYGPMVLAGELGSDSFDAVFDAPVLVSNDMHPELSLKKEMQRDVSFRTQHSAYPRDISLIPFYQTHGQHYNVYFDVFSEKELAEHKSRLEKELLEKKEIEARTLDVMRVGEMQAERDHHFTGENTYTGEHSNRKWRDARDGGWFAFDLNVAPDLPLTLQCDYWGSDSGNRIFDILIDGQKIVTQELKAQHPNRFFSMDYQIDPDLARGKTAVTIRFQGHPGATAGGLYGARILRPSSK